VSKKFFASKYLGLTLEPLDNTLSKVLI